MKKTETELKDKYVARERTQDVVTILFNSGLIILFCIFMFFSIALAVSFWGESTFWSLILRSTSIEAIRDNCDWTDQVKEEEKKVIALCKKSCTTLFTLLLNY